MIPVIGLENKENWKPTGFWKTQLLKFKLHFTVDNSGIAMDGHDLVCRKRLYGWCVCGSKLNKVKSYEKRMGHYLREPYYRHCCLACRKKYAWINKMEYEGDY